ncbi:MAG: FprA family A-type flavoprotein [Bacteroidales bacterium]|nr:FprA family A-type flavoprotein [Bacteroidales bacterium]MBN2818136.1 FprA family A-type flavoprotein [Bacteroidales bacterium]
MSKGILEINKDIFWLGALDKELETFDIVMETQYGTTYNSYLVNAEKKAVIDTVKENYKEEYLEKIKSLIDPSEIEIIVVNHTEPDHSGSVAFLLEYAPNATVYGSKIAISYLAEIVNKPFNSVAVKDGDSVSLGNKTLEFISAPNLHWPDTIYTYLKEDKLLFTCDSFGAHYCDEAMFDDLVDETNYAKAFDYYFDVILKPFSSFMMKAIDKVKALEIAAICPGHGPILRKNWTRALARSEELANEYIDCSGCEGNNILVTYVSAYGYTKQMAEDIVKGIKSVTDSPVELVDIENILLGELESKIVRSNAILVGSPTINKNTVLPVYRLFSVLTPLRDRNKKAAAFGSYGWSGEAVGHIETMLKSLGLNVVIDGVRAKFAPANEKETSLIEFGKEFAEAL